MVANHILDFQPQIDFSALWLVSSNSKCNGSQLTVWPRIAFSSMDDITSKFIEITGNLSVFYVIDCIRPYTIFKSTKSLKSHAKSTSSLRQVIKPWKILSSLYRVHFHQNLCIHLIENTIDEFRQQPHSTDSTDSVETRFRRSFNVNFALRVSVHAFPGKTY